MHSVSIKPQWNISATSGQHLAPRVLELLALVQSEGSLAAACKVKGATYRHAWAQLREAETQLGTPLLNMSRGKGSALTPMAEKLVWAGHRIHARLTPLLETLASELEAELRTMQHTNTAPDLNSALRIHASHGFAVEKLINTLTTQGNTVQRKYVGSQEAVASLHADACDVAGFHVPLGEFEASAYAHYAKWFDLEQDRIIHVATRRQGFFVPRGNPKKIYHAKDLTRPGLRFVNRQPSSGTRFLLECFLNQAGITGDAIAGFEQAESTHAAVAAYVASGMADVGLGVETPAQRFGLDFIPLTTERYFLLCKQRDLDRAPLQSVLTVLRSDPFQSAVNQLPGYTAAHCGTVSTLQECFANVAC